MPASTAVPSTTHQLRHLTGPNSTTFPNPTSHPDGSTKIRRNSSSQSAATASRVPTPHQPSPIVEVAKHDQPIHESRTTESLQPNGVVEPGTDTTDRESKQTKGNKRVKLNGSITATEGEGEGEGDKKEIITGDPSPPPGPYFGRELALPTYIPAPFPTYAAPLHPEVANGFEEADYPEEWLYHKGRNGQ